MKLHMASQQLNTIQKETFIRAPRSRVWHALTDPNEFSKWFGLKIIGSFTPGTQIEMSGTVGETRVVAYLTIERIEPETRFSWRWHPGMPRPDLDYSKEPTTLVEFELTEREGGTVLKVVESGFEKIPLSRRAAVFGENEKGWEFQLTSISNYVAGN
jgi:uncharacterized protein YndB with AHSA1/START domain